MFSKRSRSDDSLTPPEAFLRAWRLLVNRFHLDMTDCREAVAQLHAQLRAPNASEDYPASLDAIRTQALRALNDLRTGFEELMERMDTHADALDRQFGMSLAEFRETLATLSAQMNEFAVSNEQQQTTMTL